MSKFKDVGSLAKSYVELEKMTGGSIKVPGDDAKPEDWDKFYAKIGRPEKPEDYKVERPKLPDGVKWPEETEKAFLNKAHSLGLNNKQAQELLAWAGEDMVKGAGLQAAAIAEGQGALRKEWGGSFDKNVTLAQRAIQEITGGDKNHYFVKWLEESGNHENPVLLRMFAEMGAELDEDTANKDGGADAGGKDDAKAEIAKIRNDKAHPYNNPKAAGHKEAVARMQELYKEVYGE